MNSRASITTNSLDRLLKGRLDGYEQRPSQNLMADKVAGALASGGGRLIVEAGTGTGKSLAYLIPMADHCIANDSRAAICTYTKALQRQLYEKDLPFIKEHIFPDLRFSILFGSENYLCLRRLEQADKHTLFDPGEEDEAHALIKWARKTKDGIRDGFSHDVWGKVRREHDMCLGRECKHFNRCFLQSARENAKLSHVMVLNHHLYFADLASGRNLLPAFESAVFDEAHELEDVAAAYLGVEISSYRLRHLFNSILSPQGRGALSRMKWLNQSDFSYQATALNAARAAAEGFFAKLQKLAQSSNSMRIRKPNFIEDTLSEPLIRLNMEMETLKERSKDDDERKELSALSKRCQAASAALSSIISQTLEGHVYYMESSGGFTRLAATPVDVAAMNVFDGLDCSVFTSATLTTGRGDFGYIKHRLGLDGGQSHAIKSHFDFKRQAMLYLPLDLPEPSSPEFDAAAIERISGILKSTGGRTLVLFTSHQMLNKAYEAIDIEGVKIYRQGEADSYKLVDALRKDPSAVVFGTYTFWQGVDVPGMKCVVITKLPFKVPDEPISEARMELIRSRGGDPFYDYQVPSAAILLKQGFGRLIRRSDDAGVVAILDRRILTKGYGRILMDSLPDCAIANDISGIAEVLGK